MSALGIGSFLQGLGEGYDSQVKINTLQRKDQRESDAHGIAMQNAQLELSEKKKDVAYKDEVAQNLRNVMEMAKPGDMTDPATGQVTQRPAMEPLVLQQKIADTLAETAYRYGKVDIATLKQGVDFRKTLQGEGALQAVQYFMTNPNDQAGAKKLFNENGKIKIGDDVQLAIQDNGFGSPSVVGYKVGKDGQKQQVFDSFRDMILPSVGAETFAKITGDERQTLIKERGANNRTAISEGGANNRALIGKDTDLEKLKIINARKDIDDLNEMAKTRFTTLGRNAMAGLESDRRNMIEGEIMSRAEYLVRQKGFTPNKALDAAQQMTFEAQGIDTKPLGLNPKK